VNLEQTGGAQERVLRGLSAAGSHRTKPLEECGPAGGMPKGLDTVKQYRNV